MEHDQHQMSPTYAKQPYSPLFHPPGHNWRIDASWDEGYFRAAKLVINGVVRQNCMPAIEGVAGLYLFRHYLELALKYIIFHSKTKRC